ncbi:TolC family protein [Aureisphaera galaxeae]|uniref:TolC family protein n=1 Tax=Aureisphaera galaxeae TaxID=1538023 RepID=UPI002350EFEB|nr:TolC family protein [Aureisphaera galaxeae]MDC8005934.1 TolC family protein [Aureisphaera galaxeae]
MIKKFCLILVVLTGFQLQAQSDYRFTLEEAISFALDSNYTAINARRDIAKAIKQKWETTATGLPQIDAEVGYQNQLKQPVTLIPSEFSGGEPGTFTPVVFGTQQQANATATLTQLIFDGSYLVGLQAARAFLDFSENANEKTRLEVRKGVINAYGSVLLSEELLSIFQKNKETVEKNLFETRKIYENGLAEEEDVEQLEITLLDLEINIQNTERTLAIAKQMFNVALGIDITIPTVLTQNLDQLAEENIQLSFMDQSLSVEDNVDYKIAYNLTEQRSLEMKLEKSRALPSLRAFVNYGTQANSNEFSFLDSEQLWFQSSVLGVNMTIPVFSSGMRSAKTQRAKIALEQAETELEETVQNIKLEHDTAKNNYQFSIDKYDNAKKNLNLAERIENKNQIKFSEGIATSFELRQAQLQLYTAQQQYFQSMLDLINSKANLETVLNTPQLRN